MIISGAQDTLVSSPNYFHVLIVTLVIVISLIVTVVQVIVDPHCHCLGIAIINN